jgi:hypothetical protein
MKLATTSACIIQILMVRNTRTLPASWVELGTSIPTTRRVQCDAAKSHYFGLISKYHNVFTPTTTGYSGELVPTNDVAAGRINTGQHYILKLSGTGETYLYVGISADMDGKYRRVCGNAVMVCSQASRGERSSIRSHCYRHIPKRTGQALVTALKLRCAPSLLEAVAKVIVYVDGVTTASCSAAPAATTSVPPAAHIVSSPTAAPTATTSANITALFPSSPTATPVAIISSPIAAPVASSPVAAQVTTGEKCQDTPKRFIYNDGKSKICKFVSLKNTERRCNRNSASTNCPVTCGTVRECYDTVEPFEQGGAIKFSSFAWTAKNNTEIRCGKNRVRANCPVTSCGVC